MIHANSVKFAQRCDRMLEFLIAYYDEHATAPTWKVMMDELGISLQSCHRYVRALERDGKITLRRHTPRSIRVTGKALN